MLVLIALFCLADKPTSCQEKIFFLDEPAQTPHQCFLYGQPHLVEYLKEHPSYAVTKFRCVRTLEQGI